MTDGFKNFKRKASSAFTKAVVYGAIVGIPVAAIGGYVSRPLWGTDVEGATKAIAAHNMKPIEVGGFAAFKCDSQKGDGPSMFNDVFQTKFKAETAQGQVVTGAVCKGWFRGSKINID